MVTKIANEWKATNRKCNAIETEYNISIRIMNYTLVFQMCQIVIKCTGYYITTGHKLQFNFQLLAWSEKLCHFKV